MEKLEIRPLLAVLVVEAHTSFTEAREMTLNDAQAVLDFLAEKKNAQQ